VKLPKSYYLQEDVVKLAKDLIGKVLVTKIDGCLTAGIISETEAYNGVVDKACHAYGGRRTGRTEVMFGEGGTSYVYLCYGIHNLFNIVTNTKDIPQAILVRGIIPLKGKEIILDRRNSKVFKKDLCIGPGKVTAALGIGLLHNNLPLTGKTVWLEDDNIKINPKKILIGPRIGVDYAGEDAKLPYRFWINEV
jgi:DNA-3-methyladenine glycosylase